MPKPRFNDSFTYIVSWLVMTYFLFYMGFYNQGFQFERTLLLVLGLLAIVGFTIPVLLRRHWRKQIYLPHLILICILGILLIVWTVKLSQLGAFISVLAWGYITTVQRPFFKSKMEINEKSSISTRFADAIDITLFMIVLGIFWLIYRVFKIETLFGYETTLFGVFFAVWIVLLYRIIGVIAEKESSNKLKILHILLLFEAGGFIYLYLKRGSCS